jgi:glycosyltransferase involved in cell wall biosynthesis
MADSRINVLIVASSLWIGGAESVIRHLALTLDRSRFNVLVGYLKELGHVGEELVREGAEVVPIADHRPAAGDRAKVDYFTSLKLRRLIRARGIDLVHTHTIHGIVDAAACKLLMPRLKTLHTFHFGNYPHLPPRDLWMEFVSCRVATRLVAVGEGQKRQIMAAHRLSADDLTVVYNGVQLPSGSGDPGFRASIGAEGRILIGTIATLIEQKGLPDLLEVARRVVDAGHDVRFVVIGEGRLRPALEARRRELGLDQHVILTGWLTDAAVRALPTFDIFFQPSLWEAMSMVTLEAMAVGRPIVATRVGEAPAILEDGQDGLLVDPRDVTGMTSALLKLITDRALRLRLGETARRKVAGRFTVQEMTRAYEAIYEEMCR